MTTARIETVYTLDDAIKELDRRLTRKFRRTWKKIYRKIIHFLKWSIAAVVIIGFFALMFLYWLEFGYIL